MRIYENIILSNKQKRAMELARDIAGKSLCRHKHGAVLVNRGNTLINLACNNNDYSSFAERFNKREKGAHSWPARRHAELNAVLNISARLTTGGTVYVVRVNRLGKFRNSKPCKTCQSVMIFCGIKKVVYSNGNGFSLMRM